MSQPSESETSAAPAERTTLRDSALRDWRWLALILALALIARVAYSFDRKSAPDAGIPTIDAKYHDAWARTMAGLPDGLQVGEGDPAVFEGPSLRPIGYVWWLAGIYKLQGGQRAMVYWMQHGLGLLSVVLLWLILRRRAGLWVANVASGVWGLHFAPIYFEGELHATSLLIALMLGALLAFLRMLETGRLHWAALAGLGFGLAALVRPNVLLPALMCLAAAGVFGGLWGGQRGGLRGGGARRWKPLALACAMLLLGLAPGAWHNHRASGEFLPLTATAGLNLYLGQGPGASGLIDSDLGELGRFRTCFDYPDVKAHVERKLGRSLSAGELDRWFRSQAWQHMREHPGRALALLMTKTALLASGHEIGHNKEVAFEVEASGVLRWLPLPFMGTLALLLFALMAAIAHWKLKREGSPEELDLDHSDWRRVAWIQGIWLFGMLLSLLPFFAASRYRVPLLPLAYGLAAMGALPLVRRPGSARIAVTLGAASLMLAFGWTFLGSVYPGPSKARWHLDRGMTALESGQNPAARREFEAALELEPDNPTGLLEQATLDLIEERWSAARIGFDKVLAIDPTHPKALFNLGLLLQRGGSLAGALEHYRRAYVSAPSLQVCAQAHAALIQRLATHPEAAQRNGTMALRAMQAWLGGRSAQPHEWELLAACQAECGDFEAARTSVERGLTGARAQDPNSTLVRRLEAALIRYADNQPLRIAPR